MIGLPRRETIRFLERYLPPSPARVLEAGCGDGAVTLELARKGYDATGLDESPGAGVYDEGPGSAPGEPRWITADFLHYEEAEPYDAVIFTRSLHHMRPVGGAFDRARALLRPEGVLIAEELAFDRVNVHTARWLYDLEAVLLAAGLVTAAPPEHAAERRPLARWRLEHAEDPPLVSGHDMLAAARERFELTAVEEAPYLYRYFADRMIPGERSEAILAAIFELESRLIRERDIAAAGLRIAAAR